MDAVELEPVTYEVEGRSYTGYLADGAGASPAPGILVVHEAPGLTEHARERARMLAGLGHVGFAMDLYGESPSLERARELVQTLRADPPALRARCAAALDVLRTHPSVDAGRLAAIGFCFGGTAVLELARAGAELACVVGFHPGLTPGDNRAIRARVLMCLGADDPITGAAERETFAREMTEAGVDWQMHIYGGVGHSFTNVEVDAHDIDGFAYDARADRRSWAAMRALFDEAFSPEG